MLNISKHKLPKIDIDHFNSSKKVFHSRDNKYFNRFLRIFSVAILILLFLPWTQNVMSRGTVTTLTPDQRPQTIQSPIPGRIEKWYIREGDSVKKGDTILHISEIKSEYFNPDLLKNTELQIKAKSLAVNSYDGSAKSFENQINALKQERELKLEQAQNKLLQAKLKVQSDSIYYEAAKTNLRIAERRYNRAVTLEKDGLAAVKDVEEKNLKLQKNQAEIIEKENKLLAAKNEVLNARLEITRIKNEFIDKISKAESELFKARSSQFSSEAEVTKLENEFGNYALRSSMYYITAPQDGLINRAIKAGIGETFKEGEQLVGIMPINFDIAVETFVEPIDLPLMHIGEKVQIQFDGWPAIVFSGWPNASYGTFGGTVVAIENFISENGKYRILIAPDESDHKWPDALRAGAGARTMALLEDVPIWYEIWRQLNGFPPNYYQPVKMAKEKAKKKD